MVTLPDFLMPEGSGRYGAAALEDECRKVAAAPAGKRNDTLNTAAFRLAGLVAGGQLDAAQVQDRLYHAARAAGLLDDEIVATLDSGLNAGMQNPRGPKQDQRGAKWSGAPAANAKLRESFFYSAAELKGKAVPPREWLVRDLVPHKNVTLFSGDGGTGKSLMALQLAVAVTAGGDWLDQPVMNAGAIFMSAEDDNDELHRRLQDILQAEGRSYDDVAGLTLRSLAGEDALLAIESQVALIATELFRELEQRADGDNPSLIVIDTLADVYPANENDRAKVRQFIGMLRGLAIRKRCAVMLLGHPSLTGLNSGSGTSGSTAWNNSVRSRLYLARIAEDGFEPDPDLRTLTTMKANHARIGGEMRVRWQHGRFVLQQQPGGPDARGAGAKAERVFLWLLDAFTEQGRFVSSSPGPTFAPAQFAGHPDAEGCTKRVLRTAMDTLFARGLIVNEQHGKGAKARSHIARGTGRTM